MSEIVQLVPQGRLDALGARALWSDLEPLTQREGARVLVDMSETRYTSSDGLRVLIRASKALKQNGGKLVLCCLTPRLTEIVTMAGLEHVLEIYPTREQAQTTLDAPRSPTLNSPK